MSELLSDTEEHTDRRDEYGWARFPETRDRIPYGRFRNVYLYITESCQLRCGHCYMGERLERGMCMPYAEAEAQLRFWRRMGGSKLTLLGGEATLHPAFEQLVALSHQLSYEKVILTTNGLASARRRMSRMRAADFAYVQVSLDGGSSATHDRVRGKGTFVQALRTVEKLCADGFDTRIICTVNRFNMEDCLQLLPMADNVGVSLVKFHVFSGIGLGRDKDKPGNMNWLVSPPEWITFCDRLEAERGRWKTQLWYQPTYTKRSRFQEFVKQGYRGCIGRTLDRISIFPDGRAYVCSYLFDTSLNFGFWREGKFTLNTQSNEFELFSNSMARPACDNCTTGCMGGCPAEELVMGGASCSAYPDIVPVCRLWKSDF